MAKLKRLEIGFDNGEIYSLTPKQIDDIKLWDVRGNKELSGGHIEEIKSVGSVFLSINQDGLKNARRDCVYTTKMLENRLEQRDIIRIVLVYFGGKREVIYTPWGNEEAPNQYQRNLYRSYELKTKRNEETLSVIILDRQLTMKDLDIYGL